MRNFSCSYSPASAKGKKLGIERVKRTINPDVLVEIYEVGPSRFQSLWSLVGNSPQTLGEVYFSRNVLGGRDLWTLVERLGSLFKQDWTVKLRQIGDILEKAFWWNLFAGRLKLDEFNWLNFKIYGNESWNWRRKKGPFCISELLMKWILNFHHIITEIPFFSFQASSFSSTV